MPAWLPPSQVGVIPASDKDYDVEYDDTPPPPVTNMRYGRGSKAGQHESCHEGPAGLPPSQCYTCQCLVLMRMALIMMLCPSLST